MRKIILISPLFIMATMFDANADCVATTKTYTSCKAGYYLSSGNCTRCPLSGGVYGTTTDKNTGNITSCYLPSGTTGSDITGSFTYTADCYYKQ